MQWVESRVARYKRLGGITFVDKVEKTPSGKILRRVYRDNFKREEQMKARL
jgi:4-coumarate--CoA ligase